MSFKQAVTLTGISAIVRDFMPSFNLSLMNSICAFLGMTWECKFFDMVHLFCDILLHKIAQCRFVQNICFEIIYHL